MASKTKTPQDQIDSFWSTFITKNPGKVTAVFPPSLTTSLLARPSSSPSSPTAPTSKKNFGAGYEAAANECRNRVARLVRDCMRTNTKFTDFDFDVRGDGGNCLVGLTWTPPAERASAGRVEDALDTLQRNQVLGGDVALPVDVGVLRKVLAGAPVDDDADLRATFDPDPRSAHRVDWIYEDPQFEVEGFSSSDIMQGANSSDCWWLSAVATICHRRDLMDKICVARNEACGVYGFVFYRDGAWISTVVDDVLFLTAPDFATIGGGDLCDPSNSAMHKYKKLHQTGSEALFFAACRDANETWLPLLEKAYAKVHGDYNAICGGSVGEGVEDLTGGVNSAIGLEDVLFKDHLWKELLNEDKHFVFGLDILDQVSVNAKNGLANAHAYSLLQAREETGEDGKKVRLVKIRNPWGERGDDGVGEWGGPWSDGSKEWTPYWLTKLNYRFENDGVFWMTFKDMLNTFTNLYRTRLFDDQWTVTQEWTSVSVSWLTGYLQKKFIIKVKETGTVVLVLQQIDTRYFRGLEGEYSFLLHFILQKQDAAAGDYICRVRPKAENFASSNRSVSCEVELEPGVYEVLPKITAQKDDEKPPVEAVVRALARRKPQKLRQVGLSFDLAHAKALRPVAGTVGGPAETAEGEWEDEEEEGEDEDDDEEDEEGDGEEKPEKDGEEANDDENGEEESPGDVEAGAQQEAEVEGGGDDEDDDEDEAPWNAVCVIGLRVYSEDAGLTIQLAEPKDAEEESSLIFG
ncbi:hypothetical protein B0H67DRAFT_482053 [Lasiosphaeris hirsuta]|uniref:Calpain catalytic domain-containing protein n=1 Tax=Lasiosphaeris hirsuta TaxID=260670 RepID=A0AA40B250_9PEZI|nr:hypothetical protein B0H67DRAFT_482053 [Lasiosphaeris hirsuta]